MSEFQNSAIIAAIISASIALGVFFIREKRVEPSKWKRDAQLATLREQLQAYSELMGLLQYGKQKVKRQNLGEKHYKTHLFSVPDDSDKLREIFRTKRHLFSTNIVEQYLKIERDDTFFLLDTKKPDQNWIADLSE